MSEEPPAKPPLDWAVAALALPGETESGDLHYVRQEGDEVLLGVVDGLGHGPEAAHAARLAIEALGSYSGRDLDSCFARCHRALARTRGVVMSLASIDVADRRLSWAAIGNIDGVVLHADAGNRPGSESLLMLGGVVGHQLPKLRPTELALDPGDVLVLATDGIGSGFRAELNTVDDPKQLADRVLSRHGKESDDALVLVARFDPAV
jgi:negative regulator of sigma-B (phosphoserine phosphatase)